MNARAAVLTLVLLACASPVAPNHAAEGVEDPPQLLGRCGVEALDQEPYAEWFKTGYADYTPNAGLVQALHAANLGDVSLTLFFGSWCGDSKREVPRMLKLFDAVGIDREKIELIGVDRGEGAHKRSPGGEEQGREIYRVPTLLVHRGGREIGRLVEFPVLSLERDLLAILDGAAYEPNYRSYPVIRRWLAEGLLADENVSPYGLAAQVRGVVGREGELGAAAYVLFDRGQTAEGIKLMQVNCALHPDSSRCFVRLAEAQLEAGDPQKAKQAARRALMLNDAADEVEDLVALLERMP